MNEDKQIDFLNALVANLICGESPPVVEIGRDPRLQISIHWRCRYPDDQQHSSARRDWANFTPATNLEDALFACEQLGISPQAINATREMPPPKRCIALSNLIRDSNPEPLRSCPARP